MLFVLKKCIENDFIIKMHSNAFCIKEKCFANDFIIKMHLDAFCIKKNVLQIIWL